MKIRRTLVAAGAAVAIALAGTLPPPLPRLRSRWLMF